MSKYRIDPSNITDALEEYILQQLILTALKNGVDALMAEKLYQYRNNQVVLTKAIFIVSPLNTSQNNRFHLNKLAQRCFSDHEITSITANSFYPLDNNSFVFLTHEMIFLNVIANTEATKQIVRELYENVLTEPNTALVANTPLLYAENTYLYLSHSIQNRKRTKESLPANACRKEVIGELIGQSKNPVHATLRMDNVTYAIDLNDKKRSTKIEFEDEYNDLIKEVSELKLKDPVYGNSSVHKIIFTTMKRFDMDFSKFMKGVLDGTIQISANEFLQIPVELANALHKLHEKRLIHRDLKPANVLISLNPINITLGDPQSIKKAGESDHNQLYTTYEYASPHVLKNHQTCFTSDVYGLARMIAEWFGAEPIKCPNQQNREEYALKCVEKGPYLHNLFLNNKFLIPLEHQERIKKMLTLILDPTIKFEISAFEIKEIIIWEDLGKDYYEKLEIDAIYGKHFDAVKLEILAEFETAIKSIESDKSINSVVQFANLVIDLVKNIKEKNTQVTIEQILSCFNSNIFSDAKTLDDLITIATQITYQAYRNELLVLQNEANDLLQKFSYDENGAKENKKIIGIVNALEKITNVSPTVNTEFQTVSSKCTELKFTVPNLEVSLNLTKIMSAIYHYLKSTPKSKEDLTIFANRTEVKKFFVKIQNESSEIMKIMYTLDLLKSTDNNDLKQVVYQSLKCNTISEVKYKLTAEISVSFTPAHPVF